jgi:hypothetical protein
MQNRKWTWLVVVLMLASAQQDIDAQTNSDHIQVLRVALEYSIHLHELHNQPIVGTIVLDPRVLPATWSDGQDEKPLAPWHIGPQGEARPNASQISRGRARVGTHEEAQCLPRCPTVNPELYIAMSDPYIYGNSARVLVSTTRVHPGQTRARAKPSLSVYLLSRTSDGWKVVDRIRMI